MKIHGVLNLVHIELDKNHKLTLNKLHKLGFLGNWVNTSIFPEVQVFKNDVEDSNYIFITIYPDSFEIHTSFNELKIGSHEWETLRASFDHAVALIDKIYHKNSKDLDATDDYNISPDKSV